MDFVILKEGKLFALIEAKLSDDKASRSLKYYAEKLRPEHAIQITAHLKQEYKTGRARVLSLPTALKVLFG